MSNAFVRYRNNQPHCRWCVNCVLSISPNMSRHTVGELNGQTLVLLRSWISPSEISFDDIVCAECFKLLQDCISLMATQPDVKFPPAYGHKNVCFGCGISIASRRTHKVSLDCLERNVILQWIPVHKVAILEKVCIPCWLAAQREVRKQSAETIMDSCQMEIAEIVAEIPSPPPPPPAEQQQRQQPQKAKINSSLYKRMPASSRHCVFNGCTNIERLLVPSSLKEMLLLRNKLYIPLSARICHYHLHSNLWAELNTTYTDFTGSQVDDMFFRLEKAASRKFDFNDISSMDPHLCYYWFGLNKEQFTEMLESIPKLYDLVKKPTLALSIFLVKLRTGDSNVRLSALFNVPRATLERHLNIVKSLLSG